MGRSNGAGQSNITALAPASWYRRSSAVDRRRRSRERRGGAVAQGILAGQRLPFEDRGEGVDRFVARRPDAGRRQADSPFDGVRGAPDRPAVLVEDAVSPPEGLGIVTVGVPDIGPLGDDAKRALLAAAADRQREAGLHGRRVVTRAVRPEPVAIDRDGRAVEQAAADRRGLAEPIEPTADRRELEPERGMLPLEPAGAETEDSPSASGVVQRGRHLHEQARVSIRGTRDEAAHPRTARDAGPPEQRRPALEDRPLQAAQLPGPARPHLRQQMVVAPQLVEAERIDLAAHRHQLVPGHELAPDLEADAQSLGHVEPSPIATAAPVRADRSAASRTRKARIESSGSTGGGPPSRIASRSSA